MGAGVNEKPDILTRRGPCKPTWPRMIIARLLNKIQTSGAEAFESIRCWIPDYFARRWSPERVMHPIPMQCSVKLFVAAVLQDLVHQPVSSLYGSNDPGLIQNAVEQILQSTVRPLHEPASQQHLARARQSRQPASQSARQAATASMPAIQPASQQPDS